MLALKDLQDIVSNIKYDEKGWKISLRLDNDSRPYLQVICEEGICNVTGEPLTWSARKWMLSYHMCRSEVVRTAYKAIEAAVLHEMNEKFTYKGECIFDPHFDVEQLVELRKNKPLDTRENNIMEYEKQMAVARKVMDKHHVVLSDIAKIEEKEKIFDRYITALTDGSYKQTRFQLKSTTNCFCVIGVFYDIVENDWVRTNGRWWPKSVAENHRIYTRANEFFGKKIVTEIVARNDDGVSFETLASYLQDHKKQIIAYGIVSGEQETS